VKWPETRQTKNGWLHKTTVLAERQRLPAQAGDIGLIFFGIAAKVAERAPSP
jgi:hypothetical protein